jgi:hypothetical protein
MKMRDGLSQLQMYVTTFGSQIENATYLLSLKITIEDHIAKALDASQAIQRALDILIDSIADAQKGTLPLRVASPTLLLDALRDSSPSFPPDTTLPFPLGKSVVNSTSQNMYTQALFKYNPIQTTRHAATSPLLA